MDVERNRGTSLPMQEVCHQYWPSTGSATFGEFTVELLGEEMLQGFVLRTLHLYDAKVSPHTLHVRRPGMMVDGFPPADWQNSTSEPAPHHQLGS